MKTKTIVERSINKVFPFIEQFKPNEIVDICIAPYHGQPNIKIHLDPDAFEKVFEGKKYKVDGRFYRKEINKSMVIVSCR